MNEIYVALIALTGVIFSVIISYYISKKTLELNKKSLELKIQEIDLKLKEIKEDYSKSLHKERLKYYPKLYEITGGIATLFDTNPKKNNISKKELNKYLEKLIIWDEKYALFGGPLVMEKLFNSRRRLEEIVNESKKIEFRKLYDALQELEFEMKKEIGVFTSERFDSIEQKEEENYQGYEERFNKYRLTE